MNAPDADQAGRPHPRRTVPAALDAARARAGSSARRRRRRARSDIASRSRATAPVAGLVEAVAARRLLPPADRRQQRAVADEVGIAADRRGEVAVVRQTEPGVAEALRVVARLLQRAQDENVRPVRPCPVRRTCWSTSSEACATSSAACEGDIAARAPAASRTPSDAELLEQALDAPRLGALVDAVQRRRLALGEQLRDGLVGGDHQVLDQAVRLGLHAARRARHRAAIVECELRLHGLDRQRAAAAAPRLLERRRCRARGGQRLGPGLRAGSEPAKMRSTRS